jgi:hypothetical protein
LYNQINQKQNQRMDKLRESIKWLCEGPAWIRFNTEIHLLDKEVTDTIVQIAYKEMVVDPKIYSLFEDIKEWETIILKRHNDAKHPIHKLSFLAEIGISPTEPAIKSAIKLIRTHQSDEGLFQVLSNYPTNFGGHGVDEWVWCLCDAPLILFILIKFGLSKDKAVLSAVQYLCSLVGDNGWPCAAAKELGNFRGPGKKSSPCPYANLLMLKTLAELRNPKFDDAARLGIETILELWKNSLDQRPYLFRMGTDFRKFKAPFVWYDILHVLDVLSKFPQTQNDPRFLSIVKVVLEKANDDYRYTSESVWMKWKGWEFCQKREPSRWVTFSILRILKRIGYINI